LYDPLHKEQPEALEEMDKVIVVVDQQKIVVRTNLPSVFISTWKLDTELGCRV
jgi:hypothetical protein